MGKKAFLFILFFFGLFFSFQKANAAGVYYYENIDIGIEINKDSSFEVAEKQTYFLDGNFGFFYRDIELKDLDHISNIEVFDSENNRVLNPDISYKGNRLHIQWNFQRRDFEEELKSWMIKYKVHGGLGFFKDHDEIYWNAVFEDRDVSVKKASATVHLPEGIADFGTKMFVGQKGNTKQSYDYNSKTGSVSFFGYNLKPGEFLTVAVWWPKGFVEKPFLYKNQIFVLVAIILSSLIPLLVAISFYIIWVKKGKDTKINKTVIAQYKPPASAFENEAPLSSAMIGILVKQRADIKEILATIIDLAVRGHLRIIEEQKGFSIFKYKDYIFQKMENNNKLKVFEEKILESLFEEKNTVSGSDLKNKFYKKIPAIKKEMYNEMAGTLLFNGNIEKIRKRYGMVWISALTISGIALFLAPGLISGALSISPIVTTSLILIFASLAISSLIGFVFSYFMPALTKEGAEKKWLALGFKEYLNTAEKFRIGTETVETFSKFLPYAIVFGIEKQWTERFSYFPYRQQNWYFPAAVYSGASGMPGSFGELSSGIMAFSKTVQGIFISSPGGSGFGGAAGGGGGGGGGGAG